jgi:hypothetical protein
VTGLADSALERRSRVAGLVTGLADSATGHETTSLERPPVRKPGDEAVPVVPNIRGDFNKDSDLLGRESARIQR